MKGKKRVSLSVRLQPYEGTLLAEVASWLNGLERDEAKKMVEAALVLAYLPYARAESGASKDEVERCCWETQDLLDKHGFNLRSSLQVSQRAWLAHKNSVPSMGVEITPTNSVVDESVSLSSRESIDSPVSQIKGQGNYKDVDALFGDD